MARTENELKDILINFKGWFESDLGQAFEHSVLLSTFDEITKDRLMKFVVRRLGHLSDADYFNFCKIFSDDIRGVPTPEVQPLAVEKKPRGRPKKTQGV
jgi:hypothetical protein